MSVVKKDTHVRLDEKSDKCAKDLIAYKQNKLQTTSRSAVNFSSIVRESLEVNHKLTFNRQMEEL